VFSKLIWKAARAAAMTAESTPSIGRGEQRPGVRRQGGPGGLAQELADSLPGRQRCLPLLRGQAERGPGFSQQPQGQFAGPLARAALIALVKGETAERVLLEKVSAEPHRVAGGALQRQGGAGV
jgi:hypothetical protein